MFTLVVLLSGIGTGIAFQSFLAAVPVVLGALFGNRMLWRRCELFPTYAGTVRAAKRTGWALALLSVIVGLGGG